MSNNAQSIKILGGANIRSLIVSGIRKIELGGWTRLEVDIAFKNVPEAEKFPEHTLWIGVENENSDMLSDDVYNSFMLVTLYMAMYYKADLYIDGFVSKTLYRNASKYLQGILRDFSDSLTRININVKGFKESEGSPKIIGTGFSCGVDSLSTVYDNYLKESDPEYKINGLFMLNCGWHGNYYNPASRSMFLERAKLTQKAADELGLAMYKVDSNLHAFTYTVLDGANDKMGYIAIYSCILALERAVKIYYVASCGSYKQIVKYGYNQRERCFAYFSESFSVPIIRTEKLELIIDGCQYTRSQKTENIADWEIAQKYLNVCMGDSHIFSKTKESSEGEKPQNCSKCPKCMLTISTLIAIGKEQKFLHTFNLETYRDNELNHKCRIAAGYNCFENDNDPDICDFLAKHNVKLPSRTFARTYLFIRALPGRFFNFARRAPRFIIRSIIGKNNYNRLKRIAGREFNI